MATTNPITGDLIKSKVGNSSAFQDGWERIYGNKKKEEKPSEIDEKEKPKAEE